MRKQLVRAQNDPPGAIWSGMNSRIEEEHRRTDSWGGCDSQRLLITLIGNSGSGGSVVGWAHSSDNGQDNITFSSEGAQVCDMLFKETKGDCQYGYNFTKDS